MRYAVEWRETALQQLALIRMAAADRAAVNRAVDEVDAELAEDPDLKGNDYFGDRYIIVGGLWALYRAYPEAQSVHVLQVGRLGVDLPHDNVP
jgi:hypothetical protein